MSLTVFNSTSLASRWHISSSRQAWLISVRGYVCVCVLNGRWGAYHT